MTSTSLEARIEDLEAFARSMLAGNLTDLASVVNAAGRSVPLSSLAFGLVTAVDLATTDLYVGTAPGAGSLGWFYGTPQLDVYVSGGGLVVLSAAQIYAQGNKCGMYQSYRLLGPTVAAGGGAVLVGPATDRSVSAFDPGYGQGTQLSAGTFGVHTGLAKGWYTVQSAYYLAYSGGSVTDGTATNRRLAALPF